MGGGVTKVLLKGLSVVKDVVFVVCVVFYVVV